LPSISYKSITIDFIVENLLDDTDKLISIRHLEKILTDDRTYVFAAVQDDKVIGYALAYKFPSLYASDYLAYLYDIEVLETHKKKEQDDF
jgi:hypothetical protein